MGRYHVITGRKKGFTLIELLVVIAIIALLLAIVMPTLGKVKGIAYKVICASNQRQVGLALATYESEMGYNFRNYDTRDDSLNKRERFWFYENGTADYAHEFQPFAIRDIVNNKFLPNHKVLFCPGLRGLSFEKNYDNSQAEAGNVVEDNTESMYTRGRTPVFWGTQIWVWKKELASETKDSKDETESINPTTSNALMCDMTDGAWDFIFHHTPSLETFFEQVTIERAFQHNNVLLIDMSVDSPGDKDEEILDYLWADDEWAGIGY